MNLSVSKKCELIEANNDMIGISRQCELLGLTRSRYYYRPCSESLENLRIMHRIDEIFTEHPYFGVARITHCLRREGLDVNPKRIRRLMRSMGLQAIYPKPNLSKNDPQHIVFPYLLRGVRIEKPDHVWSTDITYVRMEGGFAYLVAVIDWYSRYVLSWELSNSLDVHFCLSALEESLTIRQPSIFNTDQGSQFTSKEFTKMLLHHKIAISMDGKGRALDNVFVERLWRSVKYENIYLKGYTTMPEAHEGLTAYFDFYNNTRPHQSLDYQTPADVYYGQTIQKTFP